LNNESHSVLFVCTANRIRSVMAESILREMVAQNDPENEWRIGSAGTWAGDGLPPMPLAMKAMKAQGIDISGHRSRSVDTTPLDDYALILVMERGHKESLSWEFPELTNRIHLVSEMIGEEYDVGDPVSGGVQDHVHAADVIRQLLRNGYERIRDLSREHANGTAYARDTDV
jgi:protein-tyrosine-phosphatase